MDSQLNKALVDLFNLYRWSQLVKKKYPLWNGTVDNLQQLKTQEQKQRESRFVFIDDESFSPLSRYEQSHETFMASLSRLTADEKRALFQGINEIKAQAATFLQQDIAAQIESIGRLLKSSENDDEKSFLKGMETQWRQIYAAEFGGELLSLDSQNEALNGFSVAALSQRDICLRAQKLLFDLTVEKRYFQSQYPNWQADKTNSSSLSAEDAVSMRQYVLREKELKFLCDNMDLEHKKSFEAGREDIINKADTHFKSQLEKVILLYCREVTEHLHIGAPEEMKLLNQYMDAYRRFYGEESLMRLPEVQKLQNQLMEPVLKKKQSFEKNSALNELQNGQNVENSQNRTNLKSFLSGMQQPLLSDSSGMLQKFGRGY